ncbi:MAG TPA: MraY family glycosyltransferase [Thermoanaerobaculia bacterium]|nr:MraY family glycosyltransferase [Thermoanaerobaculia bacterium]
MNLTATFVRSAAFASGTSFLLGILLTPVAAALARRTGAVAKAKSDRWHSKPTPMLGGVAFTVAALIAIAVFVPLRRESVIVLSASAFLFVTGLVDDFLHIQPYQKLAGQFAGAALVAGFGLMLPWTPYRWINLLLTFFWLVGITNAVNMLDNMDGLAAGVAAIAAIFLGFTFLQNEQPGGALMLVALAGALVGFLVYNHHPASIFMGDCGSMFIGFFLASMALAAHGGGGRSRSIVAVLAVPVLVLVVPIFDTTFVTVMRKLAGRAASQGGRDHTSHRLVALGFSERHAVWMLYGFAAAAGMIAVLVRHAPLLLSLGAIGLFTLVLTLTALRLARVRVYENPA